MQQTIEVGTADFAVAKGDYVLESKGIGSCVVICLYGANQQAGALCHIMLPKCPEATDLNPLRFADTAIPLALKELERMGSYPDQLTAHLVGGASMFQGLGDFVNKIGSQNIAAVQQILTTVGIPITSMDVGGTKGKSVVFFLENGDVDITSKM